MHSSMIGKIEKARKYAEEPERISFQRFTLTFSGDNDHHTVEYDEGGLAMHLSLFPWLADLQSRYGYGAHIGRNGVQAGISS